MEKYCVVMALLSFVPANEIPFLEMPNLLAMDLINRFVSQLYDSILAVTYLPSGSCFGGLSISLTTKSSGNLLSFPPRGSEEVRYTSSPTSTSSSGGIDLLDIRSALFGELFQHLLILI